MIRIIPLSDIAPDSVEALLDAAFGTERHGRTAYRLRAGVEAIPSLSFAAVSDGELVGSIQSWPVDLHVGPDRREPMVMVGPVAVRPDLQREGIGRMLTRHMLDAADRIGEDVLMLIGDPEYYGRFFGFTADETGQWEVPGPVERRRLLARLRSGRVNGLAGILGPGLGVTTLLR